MKAETDFRKILAGLARNRSQRDVFNAFLRMAACALAAQTREAEYLEEAKRWTRDELNEFGAALGALVEEMQEEPFIDILGNVHMDHLGTRGQSHGGEFHTPAEVCEVMARMTICDRIDEFDRLVAEQGHVKVSEPACGAGAMILAVAKTLKEIGRADLIPRLRVVGIDVNRAACDMFFINTTLWGIPATVIHGNTLSLETWGQWDNVHRINPALRFLLTSEHAQATEPTEPAPAVPEPARLPDPVPAPFAALNTKAGQLDLFPA